MVLKKDKNHLQDREGTFIMFHCFNIVLSAYAFTKALWKVENELHMCRARLLAEILQKILIRSSKSLEVKEVIPAQEILPPHYKALCQNNHTSGISDLRKQALKSPRRG